MLDPLRGRRSPIPNGAMEPCRPRGRRRRLLPWGAAAVAPLAAAVGIAVFVDAPNQPKHEADTISPFPQAGDIDAGTYIVTSYPVPFEITVPDGWEDLRRREPGQGRPGSPRIHGTWPCFPYPITHVPTDACSWKGSLVQIDPTAEAFVDAMAAQAWTASSPAVEVMVGGYFGFEFDHAAESGDDIPNCDLGRLCVYSDSPQECNGSTYGTGGKRETYRVIDLNGERAVIGLGQPDKSIHPALAKEARELFGLHRVHWTRRMTVARWSPSAV